MSGLGELTRGVRPEQEREAERRVRAVCRAGASPGGMRLCALHRGFTIHYGQPQAASG